MEKIVLNSINMSRTTKNRDEEGEEKILYARIYTYCAATVFLLMFINLGTVLDLKRLKKLLLHPVGPLLGFCSRYLLMPGIGIALGKLLLHYSIEMQLALLFTAMSPSGGLANIFTLFLKGNINLSIATTTFNSLLALGMLPFWILIIVPALYDDSVFIVPYMELGLSATLIILAVLFGITLRLCIPKTTRFIFKFLKPLSFFLSFALVALTVGLNYYVFEELTWKITAAVFLLPLIGYIFAFGISKLLCRTTTDALTIGIETSVLSMTLPILLLRQTLEEEHINSTTLVPIMSSLMSICLAIIFYIVRRIFGWNKKIDDDGFDEKLIPIDM